MGSLLEFYKNHYKIKVHGEMVSPQIRDRDIEYFKMIEESLATGKKILIIKQRSRPDTVMQLTLLAMKLTDGYGVLIPSLKYQPVLDDLKNNFNIEVDVMPSSKMTPHQFIYDEYGGVIGESGGEIVQTGVVLSLKNKKLNGNIINCNRKRIQGPRHSPGAGD